MSTNDKCLCIVAENFSRFPGGRLEKHGPMSGERFRKEVLLPMLEECDAITIDLTGPTYASSFLDESFGEIGKILGLHEVKQRLKLIADDDPMMIDMVWEKIKIGSKEGGYPVE